MKRFSFALLLLLSFSTALLAQPADFFWSLQGLNSGAVNEPLFVSAEPGDTLSLYLYYTTNGPSNINMDIGALLDMATSRDGVVRFMQAESFEFDILIQDFVIAQRWSSLKNCSNTFGRIGKVTDEFVNEWGAFTLFGEGIHEGNQSGPLFDSGYDVGADAFLFGRVDLEIVANSGQCVQIQMGPGKGGVAYGNFFLDSGLFEPVFGSAVISIGDFVLGDVNNDQEVDLRDVAPFVQTILVSQFCAASDANCDGIVDLRDVESFVSLLAGANLPVVDPSVEDDKPQPGMLGDMDSDGFVNLHDIACFRAVGVDCPSIATGDINMDGTIDLLDACPFIDLLLSND